MININTVRTSMRLGLMMLLMWQFMTMPEAVLARERGLNLGTEHSTVADAAHLSRMPRAVMPVVVANIGRNVSCVGGVDGQILAGATVSGIPRADVEFAISGPVNRPFSVNGGTFNGTLSQPLPAGTYVVSARIIGDTDVATTTITLGGPTALSGVSVSGISTTSATVNWTEVIPASSVNAYIIRYRVQGSPSWISPEITVTAPANSRNITGLQPGTTYEVQVASRCALDNSISPYSSSAIFTTNSASGTCLAPTNVFASNVGPTSFRINWTTQPNGSCYLLSYGPSSQSQTLWANRDVPVCNCGSFDVTGLAINTNYSFFIKTRCGGSCTSSVGSTTSTSTATFIQRTATCPTSLSINGGATSATGCLNVTLTTDGPAGTYTWFFNGVPTPALGTNSSTIATASGVYAASVSVTGCTGTITSANINVSVGSAVTLNMSSSPANCAGTSGGSASVTPITGTSPFSFLWNNGQNTQTISNIAAGTYTVTVTSTTTGCTAIGTVNVAIGASSLTASIASFSNVSCFGGSNGSITAQGNGGTSPYSFNWVGGIFTATRSGLTAGTYTVTVTDAAGCISTVAQTITAPASAISPNPNVTQISCSSATGSITLNPSGGTPGYSYLWGAPLVGTTNSQTGLTPGTYAFTVTDANGCATNGTATINNPSGSTLSVGATVTQPLCPGGTGSITLLPSGGTTPYTYAWSNGAGNVVSVTNLSAGTYTATTTDATGCSAIITRTITVPAALTATPTVTQITCAGLNNGAISITPGGGTSPYTYAWSNGATTQSINGLAAGTYTVTLRDANSCSTTSTSVIATPPPALGITPTITQPTCSVPTGSVALAVSGGMPAYTYLWNDSQTLQNRSGLVAGTYTVTVTDSRSCTTSATYTFNPAGSSLDLSSSIVTQPRCAGNLGTITAVAPGANRFDWFHVAGPDNGATVVNLVGGSYTVTAYDADGCSATRTFTINNAPPLLVTSATVTQIACAGGTGSIMANVSGGQPPYQFAWTGGLVGQNPTGVAPGVYTVTITDALTCTSTAVASIGNPPAALVADRILVNPTCTVVGSFTVTPTGGTAPYSYSWAAPLSGNVAVQSPLAGGTYSVTVTDANGCTSNTSGTISPAPGAINAILQITQPLCAGQKGSLEAQGQSGLPPYQFAWASPLSGSGNQQTNLDAGTYTVTVTDANGCTSFTTASINAAPTPVAVAVNPSNPLCVGQSGSLTAIPSGGTSPYVSFLWTGGLTGSVYNAGPAGGTFTVTVTDNNGCTGTGSGTVAAAPGAIVIGTPIITQPACGTMTGSVTVNPTGGTGTLTVDWGGGVITNTRTGLTTGTYTFTVTDASGCTVSSSVTINAPANGPSAVNGTLTQDPCSIGEGRIITSVIGGTSPFTYSWIASGGTSLTGQTTAANVVNLRITGTGTHDGTTGTPSVSTDNIYTVTVTDANGCTHSATFTFSAPNLQIAFQSLPTITNVRCFGGTNGIIGQFTVINGNSFVSPNNATTAGWGYTATWSSTTGINIPSSSSSNSAELLVSQSNNLTAGTYTVTITDVRGCSVSRSFVITQPATAINPTVNAGTSRISNLCFNTSTGIIDINVGAGTYNYAWASSSTPGTTAISMAPNTPDNQDLVNLPAATYTVTVTDATTMTNPCTATLVVTITQQASGMTLSIPAANLTAACGGNNNGTARVTVTGGTAPYTYLWDDGDASSRITNTATGLAAMATPQVTVTDATGCTSVATAPAIPTGTALAITTPPTFTHVRCFGQNNGTIGSFSVSTGNAAAINYVWSNGAVGSQPQAATVTIPALLNLIAGTYTVTITEVGFCTTSAIYTILQPAGPLGATITPTHLACRGNGLGGAAVNVTPPGSYSYAWSIGIPGSLSTSQIVIGTTADPVNAGTYTVTVTDNVFGCTTTATVTLTEPATGIDIGTITFGRDCDGNATNNAGTGSISLPNPTGGVPPYSYLWAAFTDATLSTASTPGNTTLTNQTTNQNLTNLAGTATGVFYQVRISDATGCFINRVVSITASATALTLNPASGVTVNHVSCFGGNNGSLVGPPYGLSATTTAPYNYVWSNGVSGALNPTTGQFVNTTMLSNIPAGTYTLTVTDGNGCLTMQSFTILQPTAPLAVSITPTHLACRGSNTGAVAVSVTPPGTYDYQWTGPTSIPLSSSTASSLSAGIYTVTVIDQVFVGCTRSATVTLTEPANGITVGALTVGRDCDNMADAAGTGLITVPNPTGGVPPYSFYWDSDDNTNGDPTLDNANQRTNQNVINLAGTATGITYTVIITDGSGCTIQRTALVTLAPTLTVTPAATSDIIHVTCFGESNGFIAGGNMAITAGTGPFYYSWSNGFNGSLNGTPTQNFPAPVISNLTAGTYTVTITDANQCRVIQTYTIMQPSEPMNVTTTKQDILCRGSNTGTITVGVTPSGNYNYAWSDGSSSSIPRTGLLAGVYTVTVTDAFFGCTRSATVTLTEPPTGMNVANLVGSRDCLDNTNDAFGNATITLANPTGGVAPYSFIWQASNPDGNTSIATQLTSQNLTNVAGYSGSGITYTVTVTDASGCSLTRSVAITRATTLLVVNFAGVSAIRHVTCRGGSNGAINAAATITTGTAPYSIVWSNDFAYTNSMMTLLDLQNLTAGTYTVTITDASNCRTFQSFTVLEPTAPLVINVDEQTDLTCRNGANGRIRITPTPAGSYEYQWSNNVALATRTDQNQFALQAGVYTVTVTLLMNGSGNPGCTATRTFTLTQPATGITLGTATVSNDCGNGGSITFPPVTGGVEPYYYTWSANAGSATTLNISGLSAATYTITVGDASGCTLSREVVVNMAANPSDLALGTPTITNVTCFGGTNGAINPGQLTFTPTMTSFDFSYHWSNGISGTFSGASPLNVPVISNLTAGTYTITITNVNGCLVTRAYTLNAPSAAMTASVGLVTNVLCRGNSTGAITLSVAGGSGAYTYNWAASNAAGVTAINATPNRTVPFTGVFSQNLVNLPAATYTVTVSDGPNAICGTRLLANIVVTEPATGITITPNVIAVNCYGETNGGINLSVSGTIGTVLYNWNTGATSQNLLGIAAGDYVVTVTDGSGCTRSSTITVTEPPILSIHFTAATDLDVTCASPNDGDLVFNFGHDTDFDAIPDVPGFGPYVISITKDGVMLPGFPKTNVSNGLSLTTGTNNVSGLGIGFYDITIIDARGCAVNDNRTITSTTTPVDATITVTAPTSSCPTATGSAQITGISGGSSPYGALWSTGTIETGLTMTGGAAQPDLAPGTYSVTIADAAGCTVIKTAVVPSVTTVVHTMGTATVDGTNNAYSIPINISTSPTDNGYAGYDIELRPIGGTNWERIRIETMTNGSGPTAINTFLGAGGMGGNSAPTTVFGDGTTANDYRHGFTRLTGGVSYQARIRTWCRNSSGTLGSPSSWSTPVTLSTLPAQSATHCGYARNIRTTSVGTNLVSLRWDAPTGTGQSATGRTPRSYIVLYRASGNPASPWISRPCFDCATSTCIMSITGLLPSTTYDVQIQTRCENGSANGSCSSTPGFSTSNPNGPTGTSSADENGRNGHKTSYAVFTTLSPREGVSVTENTSAAIASSSISVYPNPNRGDFKVNINAAQAGEVSLRLVDLLGKEVYNQNHSVVEGDNTLSVKVNTYNSGIYLLQVNERGSTRTVKVVLN